MPIDPEAQSAYEELYNRGALDDPEARAAAIELQRRGVVAPPAQIQSAVNWVHQGIMDAVPFMGRDLSGLVPPRPPKPVAPVAPPSKAASDYVRETIGLMQKPEAYNADRLEMLRHLTKLEPDDWDIALRKWSPTAAEGLKFLARGLQRTGNAQSVLDNATEPPGKSPAMEATRSLVTTPFNILTFPFRALNQQAAGRHSAVDVTENARRANLPLLEKITGGEYGAALPSEQERHDTYRQAQLDQMRHGNTGMDRTAGAFNALGQTGMDIGSGIAQMGPSGALGALASPSTLGKVALGYGGAAGMAAGGEQAYQGFKTGDWPAGVGGLGMAALGGLGMAHSLAKAPAGETATDTALRTITDPAQLRSMADAIDEKIASMPERRGGKAAREVSSLRAEAAALHARAEELTIKPDTAGIAQDILQQRETARRNQTAVQRIQEIAANRQAQSKGVRESGEPYRPVYRGTGDVTFDLDEHGNLVNTNFPEPGVLGSEGQPDVAGRRVQQAPLSTLPLMNSEPADVPIETGPRIGQHPAGRTPLPGPNEPVGRTLDTRGQTLPDLSLPHEDLVGAVREGVQTRVVAPNEAAAAAEAIQEEHAAAATDISREIPPTGADAALEAATNVIRKQRGMTVAEAGDAGMTLNPDALSQLFGISRVQARGIIDAAIEAIDAEEKTRGKVSGSTAAGKASVSPPVGEGVGERAAAGAAGGPGGAAGGGGEAAIGEPSAPPAGEPAANPGAEANVAPHPPGWYVERVLGPSPKGRSLVLRDATGQEHQVYESGAGAGLDRVGKQPLPAYQYGADGWSVVDAKPETKAAWLKRQQDSGGLLSKRRQRGSVDIGIKGGGVSGEDIDAFLEALGGHVRDAARSAVEAIGKGLTRAEWLASTKGLLTSRDSGWEAAKGFMGSFGPDPGKGTGRYRQVYSYSKSLGDLTSALAEAPGRAYLHAALAKKFMREGLTDKQYADLGDYLLSRRHLREGNVDHPEVLDAAEQKRIEADPKMQEAIEKWNTIAGQIENQRLKAGLNPDIAASKGPGHFSLMLEAALPDELRPQSGGSIPSKFRARKTSFANQAKYTGKNHVSDLDTYLDNAWYEVLKKATLDDWYKEGIRRGVVRTEPGAPEKVDGQDVPWQWVEPGKNPDSLNQTQNRLYMPKPVHDALEDAVKRKPLLANPLAARIFGKLNRGTVALTLTGNLNELSGHMLRQASLLRGIPSADKGFIQNALESLPVVGDAIEIGKLYNIDPSDPHVQEVMKRIYDSGAGSMRPFQKMGKMEHVPVLGPLQDASHKLLFGLPEEKGFMGWDMRVRVAAEMIREHVEGNTDPQRVRDFASQFNQYMSRPDGWIEWLKVINPYAATRAPTMITAARQMFGFSGLKAESTPQAISLAGQTMLRRVGGVAVTGIVLNKVLSGHYPWENKPGHELEIEVGSTKDAAGSEHPIYMSYRGLDRATGQAISTYGLTEAARERGFPERQRKNPLEVGAVTGLLNTVGRNLVNPLVGEGIQALTGDVPYLRHNPGQGYGPVNIGGNSSIGERMLEAAKSLHPLTQIGGDLLGFGEERHGPQSRYPALSAEGLLWRGANALTSGAFKEDSKRIGFAGAVDDELMKHDIHPGDVKSNLTIGKEPHYLTPDEKAGYRIAVEKQINDLLAKVIQSPAYKALPDAQQKIALTKAISNIRAGQARVEKSQLMSQPAAH